MKKITFIDLIKAIEDESTERIIGKIKTELLNVRVASSWS